MLKSAKIYKPKKRPFLLFYLAVTLEGAFNFMERWKEITNYSDYLISDYGNVFSKKSNKIMKLENLDGNYKRIQLSKKGKSRKILVHRLVALEFISQVKNKPYINHIDENPENNFFKNLEWCNSSENSNHGTCQKRKIKNTDYTKFYKKVGQYDIQGNLINIYKYLNSVKDKGFHPGNVSMCCNNRFGRYKNIYRGFTWKFLNVEIPASDQELTLNFK